MSLSVVLQHEVDDVGAAVVAGEMEGRGVVVGFGVHAGAVDEANLDGFRMTAVDGGVKRAVVLGVQVGEHRLPTYALRLSRRQDDLERLLGRILGGQVDGIEAIVVWLAELTTTRHQLLCHGLQVKAGRDMDSSGPRLVFRIHVGPVAGEEFLDSEMMFVGGGQVDGRLALVVVGVGVGAEDEQMFEGLGFAALRSEMEGSVSVDVGGIESGVGVLEDEVNDGYFVA